MLENTAITERFEYSLLGKELKEQTDIAKNQCKSFKDKKNNVIDKRKDDISKEDVSDESKTVEKFEFILKDTNNNGRTTKSNSVKTRSSNINLHPLIIKLINAWKSVFKVDYGFDEVLDIFHEIDIIHREPNEYNPRTVNKINTKNEMLEYLNMLFNPTLVRKINNAKCKSYIGKN